MLGNLPGSYCNEVKSLETVCGPSWRKKKSSLALFVTGASRHCCLSECLLSWGCLSADCLQTELSPDRCLDFYSRQTDRAHRLGVFSNAVWIFIPDRQTDLACFRMPQATSKWSLLSSECDCVG